MRQLSNKTKIKIIIIIIFLILIFPISLYIILTTPSQIGFIYRGDVGAWIGYYAAILGGALTLLGVYATIKNQEKTNREEKAVQFKPILTLAADSEIPVLIGYREIGLNVPGYSSNTKAPPKYISKNEKEKETFFFIIKNKGRGETSNAKLKELEVTYENLEWTERSMLHSSWSESYIGEIVAQEYLKVLIHLPRYLLVKKDVDLKKTLELNTKMKIQYNDMFNENSYMYTVHIRFSIKIDDQDCEEVTGEYLAVKASYSLGQIMPKSEKL